MPRTSARDNEFHSHKDSQNKVENIKKNKGIIRERKKKSQSSSPVPALMPRLRKKNIQISQNGYKSLKKRTVRDETSDFLYNFPDAMWLLNFIHKKKTDDRQGGIQIRISLRHQ